MIYVLILATILVLVGVGAGGYFVGRYQANLVDKIRTLTEQANKEPAPEPQKPVITMGAYAPPKEISPVPDTKRHAGLVETKTPELLDWEAQQEIAKLEHSS